jgi:hypothetical protein
MNQKLSFVLRAGASLALTFVAADSFAAELAPQELLRAAKKNMQNRTWKVDVLAQGEHPLKVSGLIHEQDFDITVRTEVGESRQIVIGKKTWMSSDRGKTWQAKPGPDRRFYYLTHAPINYTANEKIPPFEKLATSTEANGDTVAHVRLINEQPIQYEGDRSNAWIAMKDGKPDVVTRFMGPLVFANDYITCEVHFTPADEEKIVAPPGNANAVPNFSGPEDLLSAALKKMDESMWEVDGTIMVKKTARIRGFLNGSKDFDVWMDPKDGNSTAVHVIRLNGTVYGSLNEGETWKIEPPDDIAPYNWVHGPVIYKAILPAFEEVEKELHEGETWLRVRLKVDEKMDDKSQLPNYWIALDKDGQPTGVRRYEGYLLSQGKPLQCKVLYKPADAKVTIAAPPKEKIVNAPSSQSSAKTVTSTSPSAKSITKKPGTPSAQSDDKAKASATVSTRTVDLPGAKLKLDVPDAFVSEASDKKKDPKQLAIFSRPDGAWGAVTRGTHGITPERLQNYMNAKVASYTKGLPKEFNVKWIRHEIVTISGREWADMSYTPTPEGTKTAPKEFKDYANLPLYTRILGTSYKGQLVEIIFTSNLDTEPATKQAIDKIMESVQIEEEK